MFVRENNLWDYLGGGAVEGGTIVLNGHCLVGSLWLMNGGESSQRIFSFLSLLKIDIFIFVCHAGHKNFSVPVCPVGLCSC